MFILKLLKILDTTFYPHYCIVFPKAKQPKKEKDDLVGGTGRYGRQELESIFTKLWCINPGLERNRVQLQNSVESLKKEELFLMGF